MYVGIYRSAFNPSMMFCRVLQPSLSSQCSLPLPMTLLTALRTFPFHFAPMAGTSGPQFSSIEASSSVRITTVSQADLSVVQSTPAADDDAERPEEEEDDPMAARQARSDASMAPA